MTTSVRRAGPDDTSWLLSQLRKFAAFYGTRSSLYPTDEEANSVVENLIKNHIFFIAEGAGRIGFIAGSLAPHPFNSKKTVLSELFWWVDPAHRSGKAGSMLLDAFTEFGTEHADFTTMVLETGSPVPEDCLTRRGYSLHEKIYILERA